MDADSKNRQVLHIITRLDAGGAATNTLYSADLLRARGYTPLIAYGLTEDPDGLLAADLTARDLTAVYLPHLVRRVAPLHDLIALIQLTRLIRRSHIDLVHTHTSKAGTLGRIAAHLCGVPAIHTPHGHILYGYFGTLATRIFVGIERMLAHWSVRIISLTDEETVAYLSHHIGTPEQYLTIPSGVPLERFRTIPDDLGAAFREAQQIPRNATVALSAGRLVPIKGFDTLLRAFADPQLSHDTILVIAGTGGEANALKALATALGIAERVRFTGHLSDMRPAFSAADAFVLTSRNEGMGRVIVEAMAAKLPVLATRVGGIPILIQHETNGLLCTPDDTADIARQLQRLLSSPALRASLAKAAPHTVYPEYDLPTMIARLSKAYADLPSTRRSATST